MLDTLRRRLASFSIPALLAVASYGVAGCPPTDNPQPAYGVQVDDDDSSLLDDDDVEDDDDSSGGA